MFSSIFLIQAASEKETLLTSLQSLPLKPYSSRLSYRHTCPIRGPVSPTLTYKVPSGTEIISAAYLREAVIFRNSWQEHSFTWRTSCKSSNCQVSPWIQGSSVWYLKVAFGSWEGQQDKVKLTTGWEIKPVDSFVFGPGGPVLLFLWNNSLPLCLAANQTDLGLKGRVGHSWISKRPPAKTLLLSINFDLPLSIQTDSSGKSSFLCIAFILKTSV